MKTKNLFIILITLTIYILNQYTKTLYNSHFLLWFMSCYFNDIVGSVCFLAYCNIMFELYGIYMKEYKYIFILMLCCSFVWEVIAPLVRKDTVADIFDVLAYLLGGTIYWLINKQFLFCQN